LWIPVECTLGRHGVDQRGWFGTRRTPWTSVARYAARPGGLLLLPNTDPSPVAALRGLFIPWQDQRDAILAVVEFYVVPQAGPYESTVAAEHRSSVRRLER